MDISNILPSSGIKSVLIIDDDTRILYTKDAFNTYGVVKETLDKLEDEDDPNTSLLISLLDKNNLPSESLEDKIKSFSHEKLWENIPNFFRENIVDLIKSKHDGLYRRIETVKTCLQELGVSCEKIKEIATSDEARSELHQNSYDLIILDLMLSDYEKSLPLLEEILKFSNAVNTQFILTSYRIQELQSNYRQIHINNNVTSAKLKVLDKPTLELNSLITWKHALIQISHERYFMHELQECQKNWVQCIDDVSKKLREKIWTLDSCYINKLRITAEADDLSFSEYFTETMAKNMVSEYEDSNAPILETDALAEKIKKTNNSDFVFGYSLETIDPYENLKIMLSDLTSHRPRKLSKMPLDEQLERNIRFKELLTCMKFGTILKHIKDQKYYVHLTPPCDYIHLNIKDINNESLLFFPGTEYNIHKGQGKSDKVYQTPYVNLDGEIKNMRWNLRNPISYELGDLLGNCSDFIVAGQLRTEYAQSIIQKFSASASRIATTRLPVFDNNIIYHLTYKSDDDGNKKYYISTLDSTVKVSKIALKNFNSDNKMIVRKYRDHENKNRLIFPGESASRIAKLSYSCDKDINNVCINMMFGVELTEGIECSVAPELFFNTMDYFFKNKKSIMNRMCKASDEGREISYILISD